MRRRAAIAVGAAGVLGFVGDARADSGKTASLGWTRLEGAETCVATRELALGVEKLLGRSVFVSAAQGDLSIEGRVERRTAPPGFRAVLQVTDKGGAPLGARTLEADGSDCRALDEPVTLAVALMVDPDALTAPPPPTPPPPTPPPPTPPPPTPTPPVIVRVPVPVPAPATPEEEPWRGDVAAGASLGFGWIPGVAPGLVLDASLEPPWLFPLETTLTFYLPQAREAPPSAEVSFFSIQGGGFACPLHHRGALAAVRACGGLVGGLLVQDAEGFDRVDPDQSGVRGTFGPALRGRGDLRLAGPLRVGMAAQLVVPLLRDEFVYTRPDGRTAVVFQAAPVQGSVDFFGMLAFP